MTNPNENMNAFELNEEELMNVNGGGWLSDAWNTVTGAVETAWDATCDFCEEHKGVVIRGACVVGGIALCATGIGAGAGLGLIVVESVGAAAIVSTGVGGTVGTVVGVLVTEDMD